MDVADLSQLLVAPGEGTVFLPTDDAFAALPDGFVDDLKADPQAKTISEELVLGHAWLLGLPLTSEELRELSSIEMFTGTTVSIQVDGDDIVLDGNATIIDPDLLASNGTVHVIDAVLLPPDFDE